VIVRSDLPFGFLAAQVVHAAGESSCGNLPPNTNAVVLAVPDESALTQLAERLYHAGIPHIAIREPDPPWCGAMTAIGLKPIADRRMIKKVLGRLPLLDAVTV